MQLNALASELVGVVATIDPDAYTANTYTSDWVAAKDFQQFMAIVMLGDLGAEAEVTAKLEQATDSSGTGAKDITSKSVSTLTHSPADSDKQAIINLRPEELDVLNSFTHFRLSMTISTATSDAGAIVLGLNPRNGLASDSDLSSVDEIVA